MAKLEYAINVSDLTKSYGELDAVKDLEFSVQQGEIFGLLGPNGAGKTTFTQLLLGLIPPTSGQIFLFGESLYPLNPAIRRRIGVVLEQQSVYGDLSAQNYLSLFGHIYGVQDLDRRIGESLELVQLDHRRNDAVGGYSRGMKLKLGLARAVLHDPDILVLDEPVEGLDPNGIREVRNVLLEFHSRGKTILFSSHILSEVEQVATRVGILNHGRLLATGDMPSLRKRLVLENELTLEVEGDADGLEQIFHDLDFVTRVEHNANFYTISVPVDGDFRGELVRAAAASGAIVLNISTNDMSLEKAFTLITSEKAQLLAEEAQVSADEDVEQTEVESVEGEEISGILIDEKEDGNRKQSIVFSALLRHSLRSQLKSFGPYLMLSITILVAMIMTNSYLSFVTRNELIVLPRPWLISIITGSFLMALYLGVSATMTLAQERTSGTLQVLFFGPVDERSYVLSLFVSRLLLYLAWLILYAIVVVGIGYYASMVYSWNFLTALLFSILPVIILVGMGLWVASSIRSSRGALFAYLGIAAGLAGLLGASNLLIQLAAGKRSFVFDFAGRTAVALDKIIQWLSPFEYLLKGLNSVSILTGLQLVFGAVLLTSLLLIAGVWMLRRKTVIP
jgi:ABC-2 type transport system ATP-binding protein